MSGKSSVSIITEKKCCCAISADNFSKLIDKEKAKENESNQVENQEDSCCDTEIAYEKADFKAVSLEKTVFDFGHFVALIPSPLQFKVFTKKSFFSTFQILHFADLPPPNWKLGKLFIVFIQVFRL